MKTALWFATMLVAGGALASPLKQKRAPTDADDNIGNVWNVATGNHEPDLGPVNEKRTPEDADDNIGNVWNVATGNHEPDLGPVNDN